MVTWSRAAAPAAGVRAVDDTPATPLANSAEGPNGRADVPRTILTSPVVMLTLACTEPDRLPALAAKTRKPMGQAVTENAPPAPLVVETVVPATVTLAPATGAPAPSVTVPCTAVGR